MEGKKERNSDTAGRELAIERLVNAPLELVWEVFIKPEHIKNWWGPNGFTNTIDKMEVKVGGKWEFVMHGPDGANYPNKSIFKEVIKHERIVFEHFAPNFLATINFIADGKKTLIKWHMLFESRQLFEQVVKNHKADEGLKQNIDKLEKYLSTAQNIKANPEPLIITRIFNAPRNIVFKAWIEPKQVATWWGPKGFTNPVCDLDARPGGAINVDMKAPDGNVFPMGGTFHEIDEPNRLVFTTTAFKGADGKALLEVLNTVTFIERNGKTELTLHAQIVRNEPGTEFAISGMNQGWSESLDKLNEYLNNPK